MNKACRSFAWPVLGTGCAVALLVVLLFDRYRYYDFSEASCEAGSMELTAELIGDFGKGHATRRGSPYRLRMEALRLRGKAPVVLQDVRLVPLSSGATVTVESGQMQASPDDDVVTFVGEPVELAYDDYRIRGVMAVGEAGSPAQHDFACLVKRSYRTEWRASWFDALMSV